MKKGKIRKTVVKIIVALIGSGVTAGIWAFFIAHYARPIISCQIGDGYIGFELNEECRDATLKLHSQLLICYRNKVILIIHLVGYYEGDFLKFDQEGRCYARTHNASYVADLQQYLMKQIIDKAKDVSNIEKDLHLKISSIGGVRYTNERGNEEKRFCIIEKDGLVFDYNIDDEEIKHRLYETQIFIENDISELNKDNHIIEIIEMVSDIIINQDW